LYLQQCSDQALSNKAIYKTFARTQPPSGKMAKSVIAVLEHFQWNRVVLVSSSNDRYQPIGDAFKVNFIFKRFMTKIIFCPRSAAYVVVHWLGSWQNGVQFPDPPLSSQD